MAGRVLDQHRFIAAEEIGFVLQFVRVVHASDHLADAATEMSTDQLQRRQPLENTSDDQSRDSERTVHRAAHAGGQSVDVESLLAEADRRRMDDHRHIQIISEIQKRESVIVVRIVTWQARQHPCALESILLNRPLELAQEAVATPGHCRGETEYGWMF